VLAETGAHRRENECQGLHWPATGHQKRKLKPTATGEVLGAEKGHRSRKIRAGNGAGNEALLHGPGEQNERPAGRENPDGACRQDEVKTERAQEKLALKEKLMKKSLDLSGREHETMTATEISHGGKINLRKS
jgi:hypothetical protein